MTTKRELHQATRNEKVPRLPTELSNGLEPHATNLENSAAAKLSSSYSPTYKLSRAQLRQMQRVQGNAVVQRTMNHRRKHHIDAQPSIQRLGPLGGLAVGLAAKASESLSAIGAALSLETASKAASVASTLLAGASQIQVGSAVPPGASGVQSVQLPNPWISNVDRQKLILITQYRLINRYVELWLAAHPDAPRPSASQQSGSDATSTPPAQDAQNQTASAAENASGSKPQSTPTVQTAPKTQTGPADSGSQVDTAVLDAVKAEVQMQLELALNQNQKEASIKEFIWSDSGSSTADLIGTKGAIMFEEVRGTFLSEKLELRGEAAHIQNLVPPMRDQEVKITILRGGRIVRSPLMDLGYGDDLAINLDGGGPTINEADNSSHGSHTYSTAWNWDGNTTHLLIKVQIGEDGMPSINETERQGTPKDYAGSRVLNPLNWFG